MTEHIFKLQLVMDVQLKALKQQSAEIKALREGLVKAINHFENIENVNAVKWGVDGIKLINSLKPLIGEASE